MPQKRRIFKEKYFPRFFLLSLIPVAVLKTMSMNNTGYGKITLGPITTTYFLLVFVCVDEGQQVYERVGLVYFDVRPPHDHDLLWQLENCIEDMVLTIIYIEFLDLFSRGIYI